MKELHTNRRYSIGEVKVAVDEVLYIHDGDNVMHFICKEDTSPDHKRCHECAIFMNDFGSDVCRAINCVKKYFKRQKL